MRGIVKSKNFILCLFISGSILIFPENLWAFNMGYHYDLIRESMVTEEFNKDAYCVALAGNSYTDIFQEDATEYIIDDDFCEASKKLVEFLHCDQLYDKELIDKYWRQLIQNTYNAVKVNVDKNDKLGLLMAIGVSLHIVQDFYAHANWTELDLSRHTGIKDATYFDVMSKFPDKLDVAIKENDKLLFDRYDNEKGLFTHGSDSVPYPKHSILNKDYEGRPYFDWAYRCGYKASLQWLRLIEGWIKNDFKNQNLWNDLKNYEFDGDAGTLYTLTDFDGGTMYWIFTLGGAWKCPRNWDVSWYEVPFSSAVWQDIPNVPGIGLTEQASQDYPFLGIEWFQNCALIAKDLFEAKEIGNVNKLQSVDKLDEALQDLDDFGEIIEVNHSVIDVSSLPKLDNNIVKDAISYLANNLDNTYNNVNWLRIRILRVEDLDVGEGFLGNVWDIITLDWDEVNVNNEEVGGISDYWVMFYVNGMPYSEAEYVDESSPTTVWGVLKPLWNTNPVSIDVRMYESDPTDHKDEEMDIRPGDGKDLAFTFNPITGAITNLPQGCEYYSIPGGYFIKSDGSGDLGARVFLKVWTMSDQRIEFVAKTGDVEYGDVDKDVFADVGSYVYLLDRPDYDEFERNNTDLFTFDPGHYWSKDKLYRLSVHKDKGDDWYMKSFYVKTGDVCQGKDADTWINDSKSTYAFNYSSPDMYLLPEDVEGNAEYFSVITETADKTDNDVFISFINTYGKPLAKYKLDNLIGNDLEQGNTDYFWLKDQKDLGGFTSTNPNCKIKDISKIRIEKTANGDDWKLKSLEVWANDKLLYQGEPNYNFTNKDFKWETGTTLPKKVYFLEPAKITSEGIQSIPNTNNIKAHKYRIEAKVKYLGYAIEPEIKWELDPIPYTNYSEITTTEKTIGQASVRIYLYVNKTWKNYEYKLKANVIDPVTKKETKSDPLLFLLPEPTVHIVEKDFGGGENIFVFSTGKYLVYDGTYKFKFYNFGIDSNDKLNVKWEIDKDAKVVSKDSNEVKLQFLVPKYKYDYTLKVNIKDIYNVQEAGETINISVPKLACNLDTVYSEEVKSYFDVVTTIDPQGYTYHYIVGKNVNDSDYKEFSEKYEKVGAVYGKVTIIAKPYMKRGGAIYSNKVHNPQYKWEVNGAPFTNKNDSIIIDLSKVEEENEITITCSVKDGVGEGVSANTVITNGTGMDESTIMKLNMHSTFHMLYHKFPELFKGRIIDPKKIMIKYIPGPDPSPMRRMPQDVQRFIKDWDSSRQLLIRNYDKETLRTNKKVRNELRDINSRISEGFNKRNF